MAGAEFLYDKSSRSWRVGWLGLHACAQVTVCLDRAADCKLPCVPTGVRTLFDAKEDSYQDGWHPGVFMDPHVR